ncbi:MAG: NrfD/PsrC family molybdoenzyme membrane anchor subunit [Nitriliruptorales bacterium]
MSDRDPVDVWSALPEAMLDGEGPTYYDRPAIKEPVWIWSVPAYFYVGGSAGAAALLGAVATGASDLDDVERYGRWIAAIGTTVGTGFLIIDLGRPERFLNMLRVFRPTSPMSLGSWLLAATSGAAVVAAATRRHDGAIGAMGDLAGVAAGAFGAPLAGYTGVLIANTAVPAWQGARRTLPLLFTASGIAGAASLLELLPLGDRGAATVRWYGAIGAAGELAAGEALTREVGQVDGVAEPYHDGVSGTLWKVAKGATAASLLLRLLPGAGRRTRFLSGLLGTVGAVSLRFAVFHAGKRSARDPRATFRRQRAGYGGAEVTETAAVTGPDRRALD